MAPPRPPTTKSKGFPLWISFVVVLLIGGVGFSILQLMPKKKPDPQLQKLHDELKNSPEHFGLRKDAASQNGYRVMADYASSGIWLMRSAGPFRHQMVTYESLGLPKELSQRFEKWIASFDDRDANEELKNIQQFNATGMGLARELKNFLGDKTYVEFQGEAPGDNILDPVPIQ
jgi:hypothetical protein